MKKDDKNVYTYIEEISRRLRNPGLYGATSLMVGAGFSKNADNLRGQKKKMPAWRELAEGMFKELYPQDVDDKDKIIEECAGNNVMTLAQKYEVTFDRKTLNNYIERSIDDKSYGPSELHKKLLELNWDDVFTTNYDTLLERCIEKIPTKHSYKIVYSQDNLPGSVRPRLIKLHGTTGHSDDYIITEEDYRTYPYKYAPFVNTVQQSMIETRLCLIGFSGKDPNFLNWLGWLRDNMGDNCPSIYLCGMFDKIGNTERKMLEKRRIIVVDLSVLVDDKDDTYEAINVFLDLLKEKSRKKDNNILTDVPYYGLDLWEKKTGEELIEYSEKMSNITQELMENIKEYVCLPSEEENRVKKYIQHQLEFILNQDDFSEKIKLIDSCCQVLRKCNQPLYDHIQKKLVDIINEKESDSFIKNHIILYLLKQYRIDGCFDEYIKIIKDFGQLLELSLSNAQKNEYYIEVSKYYLSTMDLNKALEYVDKINADSNDEYAIKKANLLNQLGKSEEAKSIMTRVMAFVAQQKYSDEKKASLIGYINLVARSIWNFGEYSDIFSDKEFEDNLYNCRVILNDSRDSMLDAIFEYDKKENTRIKSFNPNSYTINRSIGNTDENKRITASFNYLLLQDSLSVIVYKNHNRVTEEAINRIEITSESPLWRWYKMLRVNDNRIIDRYFTRERIYLTKTKFVRRFFDDLIKLAQSSVNDNSNNVTKPFTINNMINVASRLSIVLDEKRILQLLDILIIIDEKFSDGDEQIKKLITTSLQRLRYSFNEEILVSCLDYINENKLKDYYFLGYFGGVSIDSTKAKDNEKIDSIIESTIEELKSNDPLTRDNAIIKYITFIDIINGSKYKKTAYEETWKKKDKFGFPLNNYYLPIVWEQGTNHVDQKIIDYLCNPVITKHAVGKGVIVGNQPDTSIAAYCSVLYQVMSKYKNSNIFTEKEICQIVNCFTTYIDDEKKLLERNYDIFETADRARDRFSEINDIIFLLCINARKNNIIRDDLKKSIDKYIEQNNNLGLSVGAVDFALSGKDLIYEYNKTENNILSSGGNNIASLFFVIYGIKELSMMNGNDGVINSKIIEFVKHLKYLDINISSRVFFHIMIIIDNQIFLMEENRDVLGETLKFCFNLFLNDGENRKVAMDGMYNISKMTKEYIHFLEKNNVEKGDKLFSLIELFKKSKLNEIKKDWV